jgi:hypothetical protein
MASLSLRRAVNKVAFILRSRVIPAPTAHRSIYLRPLYARGARGMRSLVISSRGQDAPALRVLCLQPIALLVPS